MRVEICIEKKYMKLSEKAIHDFKKIYSEEFRVELSDEEANSKGVELLNFVNLIYQPIIITKNEHDDK